MDILDKLRDPDRVITLLVMTDPLAEPAQYRISVRTIRKYGYAAAAALLVACILFLVFGVILAPEQLKTRIVYTSDEVKKYQYMCANEDLVQLAGRVAVLEAKVKSSMEHSRQVVRGMEADLGQYIEEHGTGGDDLGPGADMSAYSGDEEGGDINPQALPLMTTNQVAEVDSLLAKLDSIDNKLSVHERSLDEMADAWSMRNAIFSAFPSMWPVSKGMISSKFGMRIHPISGKLKLHTGVDIHAETGIPIYATAPGIVTYSDRKGGYGNTIVIDHGYGISSLYGHCDVLHARAGQQVEQGQLIAEVGSTGRSTGPHLHFEVRIKDIPVDPMQYLMPFTTASN